MIDQHLLRARSCDFLGGVRGREREALIFHRLAERGFLSVAELSELLRVSPATVRRDLVRLDAAGRLRRLRGGAEAIVQGGGPTALTGQPPFHIEQLVNGPAKLAIGRAAAELCRPGDSIVIDGGTTTHAMAAFLSDHDLQILTSSFAVAELLVKESRNRVVLSGGEVVRDQQVLVNPFEDPVLDHFAASTMFMGAQAVGPQGVMQTDPLLVRSQLRLLGRAERLVVLVDSSKFYGRGSLVVCPLARVSIVVTDESIPTEAKRMLADAGVEVLVASSKRRAQPAA
jgi:DeoR/GlpR family transcriptional regulator of sugar metabolism